MPCGTPGRMKAWKSIFINYPAVLRAEHEKPIPAVFSLLDPDKWDKCVDTIISCRKKAENNC